jgi:hypothetical protein
MEHYVEGSSPTKTTKEGWLRHPEGSDQAPGMWMLFYSGEEIDGAWEEARSKFDGGELEGVLKVVASTRQGKEAHDSYVLLFITSGRLGEEAAALREVGTRILRAMKYRGGGADHPGGPYVYWKVKGTSGHQHYLAYA